MTAPISPYHAPDFHRDAIANGKHRDIVGGRWEETGLIQMHIVLHAGLEPDDYFLDLGAGALRLGCRLVPWMAPGHYWGTDISGELMQRGREVELADPERLPADHLIEDGEFDCPGVPHHITHIMAFAVFTHLPASFLQKALRRVAEHFPQLEVMLFTVFLAPDEETAQGSIRQPDGVVTHRTRAPYHLLPDEVESAAREAGFTLARNDIELPRGQVLFSIRRRQC